ncbi:potassium channel family protein [uncultured Nitrosomonas sp.]|uniref:potassium channel family protein n=1 Tax=uncultured Nitrosomonas sp. TaxID=156424 RepID=UPI0025DEFF4C|nr:potassium channel family protein [uncultured Nitrosomonas sp.]
MATLKQHNFYFLLAGLLFLLLAIPLLRDLTGKNYQHISEFTFSIFLLIGIWSLYKAPHIFLFGVVLTIIGITGNLLAIFTEVFFFVLLSLSCYIIFLLLSISLAIRQVVLANTIDFNSLVGGICIYLLLGVIWGLLYVMVNVLIPGSFNISTSESAFEQLQDFIYFSFVTLATLGYGDIVPLSATARALSIIEAVFGQFYIAILVAGLVAAYITKRMPSQKCSS